MTQKSVGERATSIVVQWWWVGAIVLLALLIRLYGLTHASIWSDEGFSLELITYPLRAIWVLSGRDVHPPLYYVILQGWMELSASKNLAWARGLSVVFGTLNVALGIWLVLLISTRRAGVVAGLLLALLPIAVHYSQDVRMYAMLGTFLIGATIALVYWVTHPQKWGCLVVYAALMVFGFYTHYFSIFCFCSHWLYLVLIRLPRYGGHTYVKRQQWWIANGVMAACYIPWLPSLLRQLSTSNSNWVMPISIYSFPSALWRFFTGNDGQAHGPVVFWLLLLVYLLLAVRVLLNPSGKYRFQWLLVICAFLTVCAAAGVSLLRPVFVERYLFFSALMMPLVIAVALENIKLGGRVIVVAVLVGIELCGLHNIYNQQHSLNDPSRVADNQLARLMAYFNDASVTGDVLVVSDIFIFYAADFYSKKHRRIVVYTPPPQNGASRHPDGMGFTAPMTRFADDTYIDDLADLVTETQRVWVLSFSSQVREGIQFPDSWRLILHKRGGDNLLNLYVMCSPQTPDLSEVCE